MEKVEKSSRQKGSFTGNPSNQVVFKRNKILYTQAWTEDGKVQLFNGTGMNKSSSYERNEDSYEKYIDSLMVSHYIFRQLKKDTIYVKVDKQAEPKEGMQVLIDNFFDSSALVLCT